MEHARIDEWSKDGAAEPTEYHEIGPDLDVRSDPAPGNWARTREPATPPVLIHWTDERGSIVRLISTAQLPHDPLE